MWRAENDRYRKRGQRERVRRRSESEREREKKSRSMREGERKKSHYQPFLRQTRDLGETPDAPGAFALHNT